MAWILAWCVRRVLAIAMGACLEVLESAALERGAAGTRRGPRPGAVLASRWGCCRSLARALTPAVIWGETEPDPNFEGRAAFCPGAVFQGP